MSQNTKEHIKDIKLYKKIIYNTPIKNIVIIWSKNNDFNIEEIILSNPKMNAEEIANAKYPNAKIIKSKKEPKKLKNFLKELNKFFNEEKYEFSMEYLNLDKLTDFQREVLTAEFNTVKGTVNTYGKLAKEINKPKAYRAVGTALSKNPFPIIVPCHRTIKSDKTIGGFGGVVEGLESKKILLELEGIEIQGKKVISESPVISLDKTKQRKLTNFNENDN